jgi:prepilin-type N-terminal cleavage/methylation domain-containing protein
MNSYKGFSLIELMIVIAIIAFLAMIAVPSFSRFLAKSKRAEAYTNLAAIYAAEKAYWAEHGKYTDVLAGANGAGWKPEGYKGGGEQENFYYTYGFSGGEGRNNFTGKLKTNSASLSGARASKDGFVAYAAGNIYGDKVDILSVDENNTIKIVQDALAD